MRLGLAGIIFCLCFQDRPLTEEKEKRPVPENVTQALRLRKIKRKYSKQFKAKDRESRLALAAKLIEESKKEKDDGTKYVLLAQAKRIGQEESGAGLVVAAVAEIFGTYYVHPLEMKTKGLLETGKHARDKDSARSLVEVCFTVIGECIDTLQSAPMRSLTKLVKNTAKKTRDSAFEKHVAERIEEAKGKYKEAEALQEKFHQEILSWADSRIGAQVGGGECLDFVRAALQAAGADLRLPYYTFGRRLYPGEMPRPGDVLTHIYTDGAGTGKHHVLLITKVFSPLRFGILHQNVPGVHGVVEGMYDMKSQNYDAFYIYRPLRKG